MNRSHDAVSLHPFDIADERPEQMQRDLNLLRGHHPPAAVRCPIGSILANAGDIADSPHRGAETQEFGSDPDFGRLRNIQHRIEVPSVCPMFLWVRRSLAVEEAASPCELLAHRTRP